MNGRIYDPLIGRFMSADPYIQAPDDLQSHNRYAYVMNNPLNLDDPNGYWSISELWNKVWKSPIFNAVVGLDERLRFNGRGREFPPERE